MKKTFEYYSGNFALDCPATLGVWEGDTFIAADGSKWKSEDDTDPSIDGSGVHQLIPA